jgi:hypothetical protein
MKDVMMRGLRPRHHHSLESETVKPRDDGIHTKKRSKTTGKAEGLHPVESVDEERESMNLQVSCVTMQATAVSSS